MIAIRGLLETITLDLPALASRPRSARPIRLPACRILSLFCASTPRRSRPSFSRTDLTLTSAPAPALDSPITDKTAGTSARSSKRTAKPSRIALSKGGESASAKTSSRRIREIDSESGTDSAAIRSGRSLDSATDMTISSPRSIVSILEYFSRFGGVEHQILLVDPQVNGPVVLQIQRKRRAAAGDLYIFRLNPNAEFLRLLNNIGTNAFRGLPCGDCVLHLLPDVVIELKCGEVGGHILRRSEKKGNQQQQKEDLPAAQAEHTRII